jgi:sugar/nucleoside kinase (ribokinase family)
VPTHTADGADRADRAAPVLGVVGDLIEDVVVWFEGTHRYGTDTTSRITRSRGGSAANVAALAAGLVPIRFAGCVGPDAAGDALVADLAGRGIDVRVQRRDRTGTCVILVDGTGERTMFPDRAAAGLIAEIPLDCLDGLGILHVPSYGFGTEPAASSITALVAAAQAAGVRVSLDASSTGMLAEYGVERYLRLVETLRPEIFFANAEEAELLDVTGPPFTKTLTVVKNGARPTVLCDPGGAPVSIPVRAISGVRDSTGAGDAFAAGFLAAYLGDDDPVAAVEAGHELARTVLRSPGATAA